MRKKRHNCTAEEKAAILKRHLVERVPVSDLCDEYHLQPKLFSTWQQQCSGDMIVRPRFVLHRGEVIRLSMNFLMGWIRSNERKWLPICHSGRTRGRILGDPMQMQGTGRSQAALIRRVSIHFAAILTSTVCSRRSSTRERVLPLCSMPSTVTLAPLLSRRCRTVIW